MINEQIKERLKELEAELMYDRENAEKNKDLDTDAWVKGYDEGKFMETAKALNWVSNLIEEIEKGE